MIILIGGSSHVGKTLIAQKLMERTGYPYTSLDHLKMGFIRSEMTDLTVEDDLEMCYWMWPFVTGMIKTAIENEQNMIIEGCYIPAEWKDSFSEYYIIDENFCPEDILNAVLDDEKEPDPEVDGFDEDIHEPCLRFQR